MCYDQEKTQGPPPAPPDPNPAGPWTPPTAYQFNYKAEAAGRLLSSAEILAELFKYHPPTPETLPKYAAINQAAKNFAEVVLQNCPSSADRSAAIRLIRDARMTANASVALNGLSL